MVSTFDVKSTSKKRMLLTGSAGFIYSNFVRKAIYDKEPYKLFSIDKISNSSMLNNIYHNTLHQFYLADICDRHVMDKLFDYIRPEVIIHGAAEAAVDKSISDPSIFLNSNVLGTQVLIDMAVKYGVERFIFQSTDEVLGSLKAEDTPLDESAMLNPTNPYSASKAAGEFQIRAAGNTYGLPFIIARSCNNYGPRQTPDRLIPRGITRIMNGQRIPLFGQGKQMREWMHVVDNASAILKILKYGTIGETYHISTGEEMTNVDVAHLICDAMGQSHDSIEFIEDPRPGHDFRYSINSKKLRNLGWNPIYKFKDGLQQTVRWYQANRFMFK